MAQLCTVLKSPTMNNLSDYSPCSRRTRCLFGGVMLMVVCCSCRTRYFFGGGNANGGVLLRAARVHISTVLHTAHINVYYVNLNTSGRPPT